MAATSNAPADHFVERLVVRAATIDERLSDNFEALPGQKGDADLAARRLAAWCRSCASGDWSLFGRRLERDGLAIGAVLERFATVRRRPSAPLPLWAEDAIWIDAALQSLPADDGDIAEPDRPCAFQHLFLPLVMRAEALVWERVDPTVSGNFSASARASLRQLLLDQLSNLFAPVLYQRFAKARKSAHGPAPADPQPDGGTQQYERFVAAMRDGGLRLLFDEKPVLLRLAATLTRQWIDTSRELVTRLDADAAAIRQDILHSSTRSRVAEIEGGLSDPHNGGHSVQIVRLEDGSRVVYKPKDLRLDAAWHALIERLNSAGSPVGLKAARTISRQGYGWTEFVDHLAYEDDAGAARFFRRAGAWLALFHGFAATDMHQENMIACGDHPVPIDLEMILQASADEQKAADPEGQAFEAAVETIVNSVSTVGLLPAYGRSPDNEIFAMGGMTSDRSYTKRGWSDINTDRMRPWKSTEASNAIPNLPHIDGRYAKFGDHIEDFISGFADYAGFLSGLSRDRTQPDLFDGFAGLPVRKVLRPTRFYYMLLQRLKDHRMMDDGVIWSAQLDFIARLADWDKDTDVIWPLQRAERSALAALNIPHFVSLTDGDAIRDAAGVSIRTSAGSGLDRARGRVQRLDARDVAWQIEVIRQNTGAVSSSAKPEDPGADSRRQLPAFQSGTPTRDAFIAEADAIATELDDRAIRRGNGAAWIGIDWLGDSEVSQLLPLGPDLYNGSAGISVFLAAHAAITGRQTAEELALAGVASLRRNLRSRTSARMARLMGTGGATGLGSIVYALTLMSTWLRDDGLLSDAHAAAELFTDDLIAADARLDVIGGSAGGILGLLRLYRDTQSRDVLARATKCGEHLLSQPRIGPEGCRSWNGLGSGPDVLNGMSHGAAGFAYALAALAAATGRDEFGQAAAECIAFENSSFDAERNNWPDLRNAETPSWPCQWCHGAPGIGLARVATLKRNALDATLLATDVQRALDGVERRWPNAVDTLCCGTLGNIEFFCEAGRALGRPEICDLAARRLMAVLADARATGDYRWNIGSRQFNLGLFRGLAGVGYTLLRQVDPALPNVLVWE